MRREYRTWYSGALGREMEMLVFGHAGLACLVLPTSCGRFYEFEQFGMVSAVAQRLEHGHLQLFCVDSVDAESWYNREVPPRWRVARHVQYEEYLMREVLPFIRQENASALLVTAGCSLGGYHAANLTLRHPDIFTGFLSMGGIFDPTRFLSGYHDADCYFHTPTQYLVNLSDPWYYDRYHRGAYVLATGVDDICLAANRGMSELLSVKGIPHRLEVWGDGSRHDWLCWQRMLETYI
jgi:esterase/lipase superfamily enzyme